MKYHVSPRKFEAYKKWKQRQNDKVINSLKAKMYDMQEEIDKLRELLNKASQILQDKGLEEESKSIDCEANL